MDESQILIKHHCLAYLEKMRRHREELAQKAANYRPSMRELQGKADMPAFMKKDPSSSTTHHDSPDKSLKRTGTKAAKPSVPVKKPSTKSSGADLSKSMTMKTPPDRKLV